MLNRPNKPQKYVQNYFDAVLTRHLEIECCKTRLPSSFFIGCEEMGEKSEIYEAGQPMNLHEMPNFFN